MFHKLVLPTLWKYVEIDDVGRLGQLREVLRASPYIRAHVRYFAFMWCLSGMERYVDYYHDETSLLDLAFLNRNRLWQNLAEQHGCIVCEEENSDGDVRTYFIHRDKRYNKPPEDLSHNGPDCRGEDKRITTPEQLKDCISEAVSYFSSLHGFDWRAQMISLPTTICDMLANLTTLRHFSLMLERGYFKTITGG